MTLLKQLFVWAALGFCFAAEAQTITKKKSAIGSLSTKTVLTTYKFNGKILPVVVKSGIKSLSERKTVRDGVTREVVPFDGSALGSRENNIGSPGSETGSNVICNVQQVSLTAGFNELNMLDPTAVEIWPGRIIKISSIDDGSYTSFTGFNSRNDMKIAVIAAGTAQTLVDRTVPGSGISQASVINAVNSVKNNFGRNDFGSDSWMFESFNCFSSSQFLIEAGAGITATPINLDIRANSSLSTSEKKNKIVIKFMREAYDVKVDSDLGQIVNADNLAEDAGIIASVSYGQFGIIEIQSDSSLTTMDAALNFAFNADPTVNISGSLRTKLNNTIASFSIKGIFKGVQDNATIKTLPNINELKNMLLGNGSISATTPVIPLSFVVKSLKDGSTMMLKSSMSYAKRECTVLPPASNTKLKVKLIALTVPQVNDGFSDDEDIYGSIKFQSNAFVSGGIEKTAWSKGKTNNVKVKNSTTPADPGAYNMAGDATDAEIISSNDLAVMRDKYLTVKVDIKDDEINNPSYGVKSLKIPFTDLVQSLTATNTTTLDNFDAGARAFFVEVVEVGNSNKVRVWFKVQRIE
jgi:hypothetical protein